MLKSESEMPSHSFGGLSPAKWSPGPVRRVLSGHLVQSILISQVCNNLMQGKTPTRVNRKKKARSLSCLGCTPLTIDVLTVHVRLLLLWIIVLLLLT